MKLWSSAEVILGEEAEAVVVGSAVGVSSSGQYKGGEGFIIGAAGVEVDQRVDHGIALEVIARVSVEQISRRELKDATLDVVVEVLNRSAPEFTAKLEGVFAAQPGQVVEDLVGLTGAAAGNTEPDGAQVLNIGEIKFRQTKLAGAEVQADGCGIEVGVQRAERGAVAAVSETDFVDQGRTKSRQQAGGKNLHARGRGLRELRQPRTGAEAAGGTERKDLVALREGVAGRDLLVVGNGMVELDDEIVSIVLIADNAGNGRRIACRINVEDGIQGGINGLEKQTLGKGSRGRSLRSGRDLQQEIGTDAFALTFVGSEEESLVF